MAARGAKARFEQSSAKVLRNLNKEIRLIEGDIGVGLAAAAIKIKGEAQKITPVDKGFLINSAFTSIARIGKTTIARIGYTMKYAPFVHEMPPGTNFGKPGTENKFLEKAVTRNIPVILAMIRRFAKR